MVVEILFDCRTITQFALLDGGYPGKELGISGMPGREVKRAIWLDMEILAIINRGLSLPSRIHILGWKESKNDSA
jgi:hypothetical protein